MTEELQEKIIKMARHYIMSKRATFESVAEKFEVSSSTVSKYLNVNLKKIDIELWNKVQKKKAVNIAKSKQNFVKPQKKGFFECLFKK